MNIAASADMVGVSESRGHPPKTKAHRNPPLPWGKLRPMTFSLPLRGQRGTRGKISVTAFVVVLTSRRQWNSPIISELHNYLPLH